MRLNLSQYISVPFWLALFCSFLFVFQNCTTQNLGIQKQSILTANGNGEFYDGKLFVHRETCSDGTENGTVIKLQGNGQYVLWRRDCIDVLPPQILGRKEIQSVTEQSLTYGGEELELVPSLPNIESIQISSKDVLAINGITPIATWNKSDSSILFYQTGLFIGSPEDEFKQVLFWGKTGDTKVQHHGIDFEIGRTYYFGVRAVASLGIGEMNFSKPWLVKAFTELPPKVDGIKVESNINRNSTPVMSWEKTLFIGFQQYQVALFRVDEPTPGQIQLVKIIGWGDTGNTSVNFDTSNEPLYEIGKKYQYGIRIFGTTGTGEISYSTIWEVN